MIGGNLGAAVQMLKVMNQQGGEQWSPLFQAYKDRVEDDGGTIVNSTRMSQDVKFLEECGEFSSIVMFVSAWGGVKKTTSGGVDLLDKWYDLMGNDAAQATENNKPKIRYVNGSLQYPVIDFNYMANAVRKLTHDSILTNDYTAIYVHKPYSNTGSRVIHGGNVNAGDLGVYARSATVGRGTGLFDNTNRRFSYENPIEEKYRVDTYTPAKIFKNGIEVTYDVTASDNVPKGGLTTIGQRGDLKSTPYFGNIAAIIVFNKTLSDAVRISIENYFITKVNNIYPQALAIEQSNYVLYYNRGSNIFGVDLINSNLVYSNNSGVSYTVYGFADATNIQMGYIFPNGTIFFCTKTKVYKSIDGLVSIIEIQAKDIAGANYNPAITGSNPFSPIHVIDEQLLTNGKTMICWGNYTVDSDDIVAVFSSIDGDNCQMIYAFTSATYVGTYAARHIHTVSYCHDNDYWYLCTGDFIAKHQIHFMRGIYNQITEIWTWDYLFEGAETLRTKSTGIFFLGGEIYFGSDGTSAALDELGVFKSDIDTFSTLNTHTTVFNLPTVVGQIYVDIDKILVSKLRDTSTYYIYVYSITRKDIDVYIVNITGTTVLMIDKVDTDKYVLTLSGNKEESWILTL